MKENKTACWFICTQALALFTIRACMNCARLVLRLHCFQCLFVCLFFRTYHEHQVTSSSHYTGFSLVSSSLLPRPHPLLTPPPWPPSSFPDRPWPHPLPTPPPWPPPSSSGRPWPPPTIPGRPWPHPLPGLLPPPQAGPGHTPFQLPISGLLPPPQAGPGHTPS